MRLGLRWQILVSLVALMAATFLLASLAFLGTTQHNLQRQALVGAERLARLAARTAESALDPAQPIDAAENVAALATLSALFAEHTAGGRVTVFGRDAGGARAMAGYPPPSSHERGDVWVELALRGGETHVALESAPDGVLQSRATAGIRGAHGVAAAIRVDAPLAEVVQVVSTSQQLMLLYLGLVVAVVLLAGLLVLTRVVVRPLGQISAATERVAAGEFVTELGVSSRNEIGDLARNFEAMVARLAEARAALEAQVGALAASNAALERTREELVTSEKLATLGTLSAGIAHEVGNPLAAVMGLLEVLRDRSGLDASDVDDALGRVDRELARIHQIIGDLLDYARAGTPDAAEVRVEEPIRAAVALCGHHPRGRALRIDVDGPPDAFVWANHNRLVQVLLNVLVNAADATGGHGRVDAVWRVEGGGVLISISDDGPGIPVERRGQIFAPFYTTKRAGVGTGLGLAMSERIVRQYGGRIWVEDASLGGATLCVWLPSGDRSVTEVPAGQTEPSGK